MAESSLNDLLWFESDEVYNWLGLRTESEIQGEIDEAEEELSNLNEEYAGVDSASWEYKEFCDMHDDLQEKTADVKERIDELKEELEEL